MTLLGDAPIGWRDLARTTPAGQRVLVVDDEESVRISLSRMVSRLGYECDTVASSEEAESWLQGNDHDLVLLDIELPRMNGFEMLEWTLQRNPTLPIIMVTGIDDRDMAVRCMDAGARTYLVKPVQMEFLRMALRDAIAMSRLLRAHNRTVERSR